MGREQPKDTDEPARTRELLWEQMASRAPRGAWAGTSLGAAGSRRRFHPFVQLCQDDVVFEVEPLVVTIELTWVTGAGGTKGAETVVTVALTQRTSSPRSR